MTAKVTNTTVKIKLRLLFDNFKPVLTSIYPKHYVYSLSELYEWYNNKMTKLFNEELKNNDFDYTCKFEYENKALLIYDKNDNLVTTFRYYIITGLKSLNQASFKHENGFIFPRKEE